MQRQVLFLLKNFHIKLLNMRILLTLQVILHRDQHHQKHHGELILTRELLVFFCFSSNEEVYYPGVEVEEGRSYEL